MKIVSKMVLRWFLKKGWPWFVAYVWPAIEEEVLGIFAFVVPKIRENLLQWFGERKKRQEEHAIRKAEQAEDRAKEAQDKAEADKYRAVAEVWRDVAEDFRRENEDLKEKVDFLLSQSASEFRRRVQNIEIKDFVEAGEKDTVKVKGVKEPLSLPAPDE